ncbi:MAG: TerB family tellurite resistance protein [Polyangiales bacterium]
MIPDESVAYALAAWSRFDDNVPDGLLRAVAGAFVLVAASDGELSQDEADRFLEAMRSRADVFQAIDFEELSKTFADLCAAMFDDPEDGKRLALQCVARVKGVPKHAELVKSAAQIAASADGRVRPIEKSALRDVCAALGLPG